MLAAVETLIPVFAIILLGALLKRLGLLNEDQWRGVEDLIYYVCFPALIVATIARADFTSVPVFALSAAMAGAVLAMAAILFALRDPIQRLVNADRPAFTSIFQARPAGTPISRWPSSAACTAPRASAWRPSPSR